MESTAGRAIAIVGVGAILPNAPNVHAFWENIKKGRYSVTEVDPERWDPALYYDPDPAAPDKTYSKIGGWVREYVWDPVKWKLPIPPRVVDGMDGGQKWAVACTREALEDYGYPAKSLDLNRTAVILGNAMAGEKHYLTALRIYFPEYARELAGIGSFAALPESLRRQITRELHDRIAKDLPDVTEDTMPGELSNCIAGRIANLFNFRGPNYVCDAACASAMAAISSAIEGLVENDFDAVITGGVDRNMGAPSFVKFCKIGALSATGSRPYAEGADGFVMGEGAAIFLLKRLADAERDGDNIYAVLRGIGGSSDGKGKGITAPNPVGQKLAVERGWQNAGLSPATATYIEGHGTSTRVGDVVEIQSMAEVLSAHQLPPHSVALGSVKSNFGHLKGAAGAAGLLKVTLALRDRVLPPSLHCEHPNPGIDFARSPLYVNTELRPWDMPPNHVRRAGLSAFGFGGTNFHAVLEEYLPGQLNGNGKRLVTVGEIPSGTTEQTMTLSTKYNAPAATSSYKAPLRGALVIGANSESELTVRLRAVEQDARGGRSPATAAPAEVDLRSLERLAIDCADAGELTTKSASALKALAANQPAMWKALRAQGVFRGHGPAPKIAFLYPGQGSQYVNMLKPLLKTEPIVAETFAEADRVMTPILGKPLSEFIFVDSENPDAVAAAEDALRQTAITQPAVLAADLALTRLLASYGIEPDFAMGHSLGEYAALVAAGALPFADALEAVSARGREMTRFSPEDKGRMAAVFAPLERIEEILKTVKGYVVIANINSEHQSVIGGASKAVEEAIAALQKAGYEVSELSVSHAFHTSIVAPASEPLRRVLQRLHLQSPHLPIVANVNGEFYPTGPNVVPQMVDILAQQVASPVQFIKGLRALYNAGARLFVEVGPKKALQGFAEDVLGGHGDVVSVFTNHPKTGEVAAFNQALCCLYAAGLGPGAPATPSKVAPLTTIVSSPPARLSEQVSAALRIPNGSAPSMPVNGDHYVALGRMFADVLERGWRLAHGDDRAPAASPVTITGAALGLPGTEHVFDDGNIARLLRGEQLIDSIPVRFRRAMLDKHITRLVKNDSGSSFETIDNVADVIKLAGRSGAFDLEAEFGISADRRASLDRDTQLAIAVGLDALRDAGIPLVMRYKTTSKGTKLPDRWVLPEALRDDTGVIFASAFPGLDSFAHEMSRYYTDRARRDELAMLESLHERLADESSSGIGPEIERRIDDLRDAIEKEPYVFDRRYLFRVLPMGHSQFAEFIGARGPNTQINSACASTTQAVALAEDWVRADRCRRVVIVAADDITTDNLIDWMGAGFLATGAAATDEIVEEAAIPFDRRRHGMIIGMGAAGLVVESAEAAHERGIQPICEVLNAVTANSAFHGTRLDVDHISGVMEQLVAQAEARHGIQRCQIAPSTVFVSHETYTPARGGSAAAEIHALRRVFGKAADQVVIANTKGFTGHAMGAGVEDVLAVKALETGIVPPVANFKETDPELGALNLSKGGAYPVEYALRLGAGFGSQISMSLLRWVPTKNRVRRSPNALGYEYRIADRNAWSDWLSRIAGDPSGSLEVVGRTLRVREQRPAAKTPGTGSPRMGERAAPSVAQPISTETPLAKKLEPVLAAQPTELAVAQATVAPSGSSATAKLPSASATPVVEPKPLTTPRKPVEKAPPAPVAVAVSSAKLLVDEDSVRERVLALVAEKTGYPQEMLDVDLDLEADLGIDTVKQAETFAAIREIYNIPRDENRKLRDYPTLAHVIRFVIENRPDLAKTHEPPATASATKEPIKPTAPILATDRAKEQVLQPQVVASSLLTASSGTPSDENSVKERILALVVEKTGYPKEMLDLDLDLEADLGIDTVKQAEMFAAIREIYYIPRDENRKLRDYPTLAHVIQFVYEKRPDLSTATEENASAEPKEEAAPVPATVPATQGSPDPIKERILDLVVEKTGYLKEMLDLELDLEADLGIDTVKQAELFAAIRAAYNIPRDENLKLRDFPTLAHVIQFAHDRSGSARSQTAQQPQAAAPMAAPGVSQPSALSTPTKTLRPTLASFDAANAIPRRVPVPILRPPLVICRSTGVVLAQGARIIVASDKGGVAAALADMLETKDVEVLQLDPDLDFDSLTTTVKRWTAERTVQGIYWLPALDVESPISQMDRPAWREAVRVRVKSLYATMRALYEQIASPGTFLISATRLGGQHGYGVPGAVAPLGGAVVGFTKAYGRERPDTLVKAIDFEAAAQPLDLAALLIEETVRDPGAVEIGYKSGLRWTIGLQEQSAIYDEAGMTLDEKTVFVITGAAGSIVSAITADLAASSGGTFYLLDVVPQPDSNNSDLKHFVEDKESLKRELFARMQARGQRPTPALVEKDLAAIERAEAARSAIEAVHASGGRAQYLSVDLRDAEAVARAIDQVRRASGHIDVLLHAAGVDRSRSLAQKEPNEFDFVFDVKSDGFFNLLHAAGDMPVSATVVFSSIAGRFGNAGQTDYSAANDLLCKITSSFRTTRPATRGIAVDWTAWAGIGMASRGSIPKVMEMAGIDMLPPEAGVPLIRRELTAGGTHGEIVIGQRLGVLLKERDETGGVDPALAHSSPAFASNVRGPIAEKIVRAGVFAPLTIETTLDPKIQPFLYDHRIDGTAVLPGVMGLEAFAEAALYALPDWRVAAIESVDFLAPFKFYRDEPRTIAVEAVIRPADANCLIVDCRLLGHRSIANQHDPQITSHFAARVQLAKGAPNTVPVRAFTPTGFSIGAKDIYDLYFHGPAYRVIEQAWWDGKQVIALIANDLPANHCPVELSTTISPRSIEACFQAAGIWEMGMKARMGLPLHIDRVRFLRSPDAADSRLYALVVPDPDNAGFDAEVVDAGGNVYLQLVGYRTIALPDAIDPERLKVLQRLFAAEAVVAA